MTTPQMAKNVATHQRLAAAAARTARTEAAARVYDADQRVADLIFKGYQTYMLTIAEDAAAAARVALDRADRAVNAPF